MPLHHAIVANDNDQTVPRRASTPVMGVAHLLLVGVSHRTAPLSLRERLAIPTRELATALATLRAAGSITEAVILSTCNRVELYVVAQDPAAASQDLLDFFSYQSRLSPAAFQSRLYRLSGSGAARHLFRVAAGLDSMVLGESEITAQVKQAYELAHAAGATGPWLNRLFQRALHSTKLVRSRTRIAEGQASIGSVVVGLARQMLQDRLQESEVLLWGAGKAAQTTARHLIKHGIRQLWIVSRTQTKAQDLASACTVLGTPACPAPVTADRADRSLCQTGWLAWEQALSHLSHVDIAIVCTQAPHYVIDAADAATFLPQRGGRSLCLIDLAVPRNVDPSLRRQAGIRLYDIDDLQTIAQTALTQRQQERERCEALIQEQVRYFLRRELPISQKEDLPCRSVEAFS